MGHSGSGAIAITVHELMGVKADSERGPRRVIVLLFTIALTSAGCTGGSNSNEPRSGGSIVIAAEQWPDCLNPITQCSAGTWVWFAVLGQVMPKAMELDEKGNWRASPLLVEAPSLENGLMVEEPFSLTYKIKPAAVWDDGTPITSSDLEFTWQAILNTKGAYSTLGYDQIESIDTTDPKVAVIRFKDVFVDWPDLFGGPYAGIIQKSSFPNVDEAKPDVSGEMLDAIPFSGGPWRLQAWSRYEGILVRNPRYWATESTLDRVRFIPILDQSGELKAIRDGKVSVIYPQPGNADLIGQLKVPHVRAEAAAGAYYEALFFNVQRPPMNEPLVREALMYAIDRERVVDEVVHFNDPSARVLNCGFLSLPNLGPWCQSQPFAPFTHDPEKAASALKQAGFDCSKAPAEPCSRDRKVLRLVLARVETNTRWVAQEQLMQEDARAVGIDLVLEGYPPFQLFSAVGPQGKFHILHVANGGLADPSVTYLLSCDQIPTPENAFGGGNWNRWCNPEADALMKQSDRALDPVERLQLLDQLYQIEVKDRLLLPLVTFSNFGAWRTDQVAGPLGDWIPSLNGMFYDMARWSLPPD
jgi:peptide/nickel transport system substrate-binding protein